MIEKNARKVDRWHSERPAAYVSSISKDEGSPYVRSVPGAVVK